jgi:hypothetical protein
MKPAVGVSRSKRAAVGAGVELTVFVKVSASDGKLTARKGADSVRLQAVTPNSSSTMPTQSLILSISLYPVTSSSTFRNLVSYPSLYGCFRRLFASHLAATLRTLH